MITIEKAKITDVPDIHRLVNHFADRGDMLARPLSDIYENLRDYFVIRNRSHRIVACVALHIAWSDIAEVRSLAVASNNQKKGLGAELVKSCIEDAKELGIPVVFCLTYKPVFFEKLGFSRVEKMTLPRKVWTECFHCPKFPDCEEVALVYDIKEAQLG